MLTNNVLASLGRMIRRAYNNMDSSFLLRFECWNSVEHSENFKKLMIDDNPNPAKCFSTMELSIVDTAIKMLKAH